MLCRSAGDWFAWASLAVPQWHHRDWKTHGAQKAWTWLPQLVDCQSNYQVSCEYQVLHVSGATFSWSRAMKFFWHPPCLSLPQLCCSLGLSCNDCTWTQPLRHPELFHLFWFCPVSLVFQSKQANTLGMMFFHFWISSWVFWLSGWLFELQKQLECCALVETPWWLDPGLV